MTDPDLGKIRPGHVCKHGIRWPHPCDECDAAPPPPMTSIRTAADAIQELLADIDRELEGPPGSPDNRRRLLRRSRDQLRAIPIDPSPVAAVGVAPSEAMIDAAARQLYKDYEGTTDERVKDVFGGDWSVYDDEAEWSRTDIIREMREWATSALTAALNAPQSPAPVSGEVSEAPPSSDLFDAQAFGERVAAKLEKYSLSYRDAAREVPCSSATLNRVARGSPPDVENYLRLSRWLTGALEPDRSPSRAFLEEVLVTLEHARTFITSREKMHPTGVGLYDEDIAKLREALRPGVSA